MKTIAIGIALLLLSGCSVYAPTFQYTEGDVHLNVTEPAQKPAPKPRAPVWPTPEPRYKQMVACVKENVDIMGKPDPKMYATDGRFVDYTRALDAYIDILTVKLGKIAEECL